MAKWRGEDSGENQANESADKSYWDGDKGDAFRRIVANYKIHLYVDRQRPGFLTLSKKKA